MKHSSIKMYGYHNWANEKLLNHLVELPEEIYREEIKSVFPSIAETVSHIHIFDHVWFGAMQEKNTAEIGQIIESVSNNMKKASIKEVQQMFTTLSEQFHVFLEQQKDMEHIVVAEHPEWGSQEFLLSDMLHHVVNHGTYHRGNITAMLRQQGHKGISTDYIFYVIQ